MGNEYIDGAEFGYKLTKLMVELEELKEKYPFVKIEFDYDTLVKFFSENISWIPYETDFEAINEAKAIFENCGVEIDWTFSDVSKCQGDIPDGSNK